MVSFRIEKFAKDFNNCTFMLNFFFNYLKETGQENLTLKVHYEDNGSLITTDSLKEKTLGSLINSYKKREM